MPYFPLLTFRVQQCVDTVTFFSFRPCNFLPCRPPNPVFTYVSLNIISNALQVVLFKIRIDLITTMWFHNLQKPGTPQPRPNYWRWFNVKFMIASYTKTVDNNNNNKGIFWKEEIQFPCERSALQLYQLKSTIREDFLLYFCHTGQHRNIFRSPQIVRLLGEFLQ